MIARVAHYEYACSLILFGRAFETNPACMREIGRCTIFAFAGKHGAVGLVPVRCRTYRKTTVAVGGDCDCQIVPQVSWSDATRISP